MHIIGSIDLEMFKCISNGIITDEVILTDERVEHIINRRGQDFYDRYGKYFADILKNPDYIFRDKPNTALVCKKFRQEEKYINVVLRLAVSTDNPNYKNSVLTAIGENEKRFRQRLRNNTPLYKKE
ncbi:MAG: hypothetical protein LUH53_06855 [Lachnospiraceae bacterium]|nr:hypothetical protein [Lachnospiraceae bacterium]